MTLILVLLICFCCACGPSWENVIQHSNGVYEDTKTGECWIYKDGQHLPVQCPNES